MEAGPVLWLRVEVGCDAKASDAGVGLRRCANGTQRPEVI